MDVLLSALSPSSTDDQQADNVAQFPDLASRSWVWPHDRLREKYRSLGVYNHTLERTLAVLGEIYMQERDGYRVSDAKAQADPVEAINQWITRVVIGMLIEIADREIELIELRNSAVSGPQPAACPPSRIISRLGTATSRQ